MTELRTMIKYGGHIRAGFRGVGRADCGGDKNKNAVGLNILWKCVPQSTIS